MVDAAMVVLSDKVGVGDESEKDRIVVGSVGWRGSIGGEWMFEGVRQLMEMKVVMMVLKMMVLGMMIMLILMVMKVMMMIIIMILIMAMMVMTIMTAMMRLL